MERPLLVTGGLGFLGQHLVQALLEDGRFRPVILDNSAGESVGGAEVIAADVRDPKSLSKIFAHVSPACVVHAAAQLPRASTDDIWSTTVDGTRNILELSRESGVERTIFISSTAVYAMSGGPPHREEEELAEGFGIYGEAKVEAERLCAHARAEGQFASVIRPKSFIGTGRMGIFQVLFQWILEGRRIPMIGKGGNRFQLLDVEDLCSAILTVLLSEDSEANSVLNVGATDYGTVASDMTALCEHAGTGARVLPIPVAPTHAALSILYKVGLSPIYPWVFRTAGMDSEVNVDRMLSTGWAPEHSNAGSLIRAYDWYREYGVHRVGAGPQTGHRAAWSQGALGLLRHLF